MRTRVQCVEDLKRAVNQKTDIRGGNGARRGGQDGALFCAPRAFGILEVYSMRSQDLIFIIESSHFTACGIELLLLCYLKIGMNFSISKSKGLPCILICFNITFLESEINLT